MSPKTLAESILVADIGEVNTRAFLFDVVDGRYRFVASGISSTTVGYPLYDVGHGMRLALDNLENISGRTLIGDDERLIVPAQSDGTGIDAFTVVMSAGAPLKILIVGLLSDISIESAQRLAETTYTQIVDIFQLNDRRNTQMRINSIGQLRPDIILITGGTENGARQAVLKLVESVGLACYLLPEDLKPQVLYAGNHALSKEIEDIFMPLAPFTSAPNIRPTLDAEQLAPAQAFLARVYRQSRIRQISGVQELDHWAKGQLLPGATAFNRMIRLLSLQEKSKGVLGVDVGFSATSVVVAREGQSSLGTYPQYGLRDGGKHIINKIKLQDITRWLYLEISDDDVRDYIFNKSLFPSSLPATANELMIEQAITRQLIRLSLEKLAQSTSNGDTRTNQNRLPVYESIVASGSVLTKTTTLAQSALILLDAVVPIGITTLLLDQNNLIAALGVAASINPIFSAQLMDTGTLLNIGTVISPISDVRPGVAVLRVHIRYENGVNEKHEIKKGDIHVIPLTQNQSASLHLKPLHGADIGLGGGRGCRINRVVGGALGLIIDARGRPIPYIKDIGKRRTIFVRWLRALGG